MPIPIADALDCCAVLVVFFFLLSYLHLSVVYFTRISAQSADHRVQRSKFAKRSRRTRLRIEMIAKNKSADRVGKVQSDEDVGGGIQCPHFQQS